MGGEDLFLEVGPYFCFVFTSEEAPGKWIAWVTFERKADHAAAKSLIPGMRHLIKAKFASESDARKAAVVMAHEKIEAGDVGL